MAVTEFTTKCPYCGGLLKDHSYGVVKCSCCNTIFKIEKKNPDALNKANDLRRSNSFAEALSLYNEILESDPKFPEANWGALLSEYGVEYIKDNELLIPTIHRPVQNYKITEDKYAIALLANTFGDEHDDYLSRINELEKLRQQIEDNCNTLPKYDVFISCKITKDDVKTEEKTEEYKWGELVYKKLVQRGLKVFFSPYSLPSSNGAYEPIIYSALQSSKYLVVLASESKHLCSKWIKNEWERFLEIRKRDKNSRYYKLVIDSSFAKEVPYELKSEVSFIAHDGKMRWLADLEKAIVDAFPNIKDAQYSSFNPFFETVDLSQIRKQKNKELKPTELINTANSILIVPQNPYTIHYHDLETDYTLEDNVKTCIRMVEIQLRIGNFQDAQYELNKYLNFISDASNLDFNILVLQMLIDSKSNSIDDFFENRISSFSNFDLFNRIVNKLPVGDAEKYLLPLSEYIIDSIKNNRECNAFDFYKAISNISCSIIKETNYKVLQCLPYIYERPSLLMQYADIAIPYVSSCSVEDYIRLCSDLAMGLCKNALWKEALVITNKLKEADPQNSKIALISLMIDSQARTLNDLMEGIESRNAFIEIEDLIPNLYRTGVVHLINVIKTRIISLIDNSQYDVASQWAEIVVKTDFDGRSEYFDGLIERCKSIPQSDELFSVLIQTLGEEKRDYYIHTTLSFVANLLRSGNFTSAKKYCKELNEYDEDNAEILNYYLCAEMETVSSSFDNIDRLKDMSIIEKMLLTRDTVFARQELLLRVVNACIKFVDRNEINQDNNVFIVFDKILTYFTEINENVKKKVNLFAEKCVQKGLFDKAKWYYVTLIRWDQEYHQAYWGIILSDRKCRNNNELIESTVLIDTMPEYSLAVMYAKGDEKYENMYSSVLSQQLHFKRKEKLPMKALVVGVGVLIVAVVAFVLWRILA